MVEKYSRIKEVNRMKFPIYFERFEVIKIGSIIRKKYFEPSSIKIIREAITRSLSEPNPETDVKIRLPRRLVNRSGQRYRKFDDPAGIKAAYTPCGIACRGKVLVIYVKQTQASLPGSDKERMRYPRP